jgi:hypothetical protein
MNNEKEISLETKYLHAMANPITMLSIVIKKLEVVNAESASDVHNQVILIGRASKAIEELKNIHADFKKAIFFRDES